MTVRKTTIIKEEKMTTRIKKIIMAAVLALTLASADFCSYAAQTALPGERIAWNTELNAWEMTGMTDPCSNYVRYMIEKSDADTADGTQTNCVSVTALTNGAAATASRDWCRFVTKEAQGYIMDFILGNAYTDTFPKEGICSSFRRNSCSGAEYSAIFHLNETEPERAAIADANRIYQKNLSLVAWYLTNEAGVTENDTPETALLKTQEWLRQFKYSLENSKFSVEDALRSHCGVCSQFSQIFKYACDVMGIPCRFVRASGGGHAYVIVTVGETEYKVDIAQNIYPF